MALMVYTWQRNAFGLLFASFAPVGFAEYAGHAFEWDDPVEAAQESDTEADNEPGSAVAVVGAVQMRRLFGEG